MRFCAYSFSDSIFTSLWRIVTSILMSVSSLLVGSRYILKSSPR